jgi:hypothetical protein
MRVLARVKFRLYKKVVIINLTVKGWIVVKLPRDQILKVAGQILVDDLNSVFPEEFPTSPSIPQPGFTVVQDAVERLKDVPNVTSIKTKFLVKVGRTGTDVVH